MIKIGEFKRGINNRDQPRIAVHYSII